jgi:hypothetical protein
MKWRMLAVLALFCFCRAANAQTRYFATTNLGTAQTLGYKVPSYGASFAIEKPLGRFELQGLAGVFKTAKLDSGTGHSAKLQGASYWFPVHAVGIGAKVSRNWLWTDAYDKHVVTITPTLLLQGKMGIPARLYVGYLIPQGCGNCEGIQSSRTHGLEIYWEGEFGHLGPVAFVMGHKLDVLRFKDQTVTGAPPSTWIWHSGAMYEPSLRLRFGRGRGVR